MRTDEEPPQITERTGVSLKVLLGACSAVLIPIFGATFYVAVNITEIRAQLTSMTSLVLKAGSDNDAIMRRISEHVTDDTSRWTDIQQRLVVIEKSGSEKVHEMEKRVNELEIQLRVHTAQPPTK